ncbi:DGQHR domain-containing protein [Maricaulis sp.]|uniref:DGQHR domain-containing protein n=1 Tax=Maricaulis sp. TaxID=1486257 RepID=UPI003A951D33
MNHAAADEAEVQPLQVVGHKFLPELATSQEELRSLARVKKKASVERSVHSADVPEFEADGWTVQRPGKRSTRIKKEKSHDKALEDRIWCLLNSMGYQRLNSERFHIAFERSNGTQGKKQIDAYAEDQETALVVECKSSATRRRRSLQKDILETVALQNYIRNSIYQQYDERSEPRPKVLWVYATQNIIWSDSDLERASDADVHVITENEIQYFETFSKHMGPAGRYQILGEFLKGQKVPGLADVRIPAIRGSIGGETFYSFVCTPRHLLKIAFVNHQALNHPDGKPAYQRMISSSRIRKIGEFISKGGYFPTNLLVNFTDKPRFDRISNKENTDPSLKFGWLTLPAKYRSAWVIDGQHRLYGFSHLDDQFLDQSLFILAFEGMAVEKEADLFITINHEQKSVPRSLLVSLLADIRMGDSNPNTALTALASGIFRNLNISKSSPLSRRFAVHGVPPEASQNLTVSEAVNGLKKSGLIGRVIGNKIAPGPLSGPTDEQTIERASKVLSAYFDAIRDAHPSRWEEGKAAYVSTNPGIRSHLAVMGEVVSYLSHKKSIDFIALSPEKFASEMIGFVAPLVDYLQSATDAEIKEKFSRRFGEAGVKEYTYHLMTVLAETHSDFGPEGFKKWVTQNASDEIDSVNHFVMKLAERLTDTVIETLKQVHGTHRLASGDPAFWEKGVENNRVRKNAYDKQQADTSERRKPKEAYLDVLDLRDIVKQTNNWAHFEHIFKNPMPGDRKGQKYYLDWMQKFNDVRRIAAHKNQLKTYSDEDLEFVDWLRTEVSPKVPQ